MTTEALTIDFQNVVDSDAGVIKAEIDDRPAPDGLNLAGSNFKPGDQAAYLVFTSDSIQIKAHRSTGSAPRNKGSGTKKIEDVFLTFSPGSLESKLTYPVSSNFQYAWDGGDQNGAGSVALVNDTTIRVTPRENDEFPVGILKVSYQSKFTAYSVGQATPSQRKVLVLLVGVPKEI